MGGRERRRRCWRVVVVAVAVVVVVAAAVVCGAANAATRGEENGEENGDGRGDGGSLYCWWYSVLPPAATPRIPPTSSVDNDETLLLKLSVPLPIDVFLLSSLLSSVSYDLLSLSHAAAAAATSAVRSSSRRRNDTRRDGWSRFTPSVEIDETWRDMNNSERERVGKELGGTPVISGGGKEGGEIGF